MTRNADSVAPPKRQRGRPKGAKDRKKRIRRSKTAFEFNVGARTLSELAATAGAIDMVGLLRFVQLEFFTKIVEEVASPDHQRLAALLDAFQTLHRMEIERIKANASTTAAPKKSDDAKSAERRVINLEEFRTYGDPE